jgi:gliding motility-associated-like protein
LLRLQWVKPKYLVIILSSLFLLASNTVMGQISAPAIECINNITSFSFAPPSGLGISTARWSFGDGSTSNSNAPKYIYKKTGKFKVIVEATLSNSNVVTDSAVIEIAGLPLATFSYLGKSDTCFNRNNVCLTDLSKPSKNGQTITQRLIVWGDGAFNSSVSPGYGDMVCHKYATPDKYLLKMEVTDIYGCKNTYSSYVEVLAQTTAAFKTDLKFSNCTTKQLCISNTSKGLNTSSATYQWLSGSFPKDTNPWITSRKCVDFKSNKSDRITLIVKDANGCIDSASAPFFVFVDSMPQYLSLTDSVFCFSASLTNTAFVNAVQSDRLFWELDNQLISNEYSNLYQFNAKDKGLMPGVHTISLTIVRGTCTKTFKRKFVINGPVAGMKILDNNQCFTNRPVSFIDDSKYSNRKSSIYLWTLEDALAPSCIIHEARNINKGKNCTFSRDWYMQHQYDTSQSVQRVKLWVKDTVNGCEDSIIESVRLKVCSPIITQSRMNYCEGALFTKSPSALDPKFITLDSGKTWKKFPVILPRGLSGKIDVGFIFETVLPEWAEKTKADTIKVRRDTLRIYDTIYKKEFLDIHSFKQDSLTFKFYGKCSPYRLSVHFEKGMFYAGEKLEINWNDGSVYLKVFTETTHIDSIMHTYRNNGFNKLIVVRMNNSNQCEVVKTYLKQTGKLISTNNIPRYFCSLDTTLCFEAKVFDIEKKTFWNNTQLDKGSSWNFSGDSNPVQAGKTCRIFPEKGIHYYRLIIADQLNNCSDTLNDSFFVQDLQAGIKNTSRQIFCSELKQFFDSSYMLWHRQDSIIDYVWDFGTGTFSNPQKDPFKSLNTSAEYLPVTHAVKTLKGCVDTIRFDLKIIGSHPYFKITDTIACDSLNTHFLNLSRSCVGYIWEFGDSARTSFATDKKENAGFNYTKPGRYYIHLYGYDSIYNPATNAVYFCNNIFPDPIYQKDSIRSVVVIPSLKTGILSPDTVCIGSEVKLRSLSDTNYQVDKWLTGDDSMYSTLPGKTITHRYVKPGNFWVRLWPSYNTAGYNQCSDSAQKNILVIGVKADFDFDPNSKSGIFKFNNRSAPFDALLNWDFGQPSSGANNYSSEQNPFHNYGLDTGEYTVCLRASLPFGCADTVCKPLMNHHKPGLLVFNVFTPGNDDGKNDQYDIIIENEEYYHLRIYDRWGVLVFEGNEDDDNTGTGNWNGRVMNKGNLCPPGTYYYLFDYRLKTTPEKTETINGVVTLIR